MREIAKFQSTKKVIFISEDNGLRNSFKTASKAIDNIDITCIMSSDNLSNYSDKLFNAILLYVKSREEKYTLLLERIIVGLKCNIPIIAIGYHKLNITEDLRDLVFEKVETRKSYRYFQIPFSLKDLSNAISEIKPFPKRKLPYLIKKYCDWKGILDLILTHEIPNRLRVGSKNEAVNLYKRVKAVLSMVGVSAELISHCDSAISEIETQDLEKSREKLIERAEQIAKNIKEEI
jgi:hypothetical protein